MAIRKYKPTTPGRRGSSVADFVEVTRSEPEKSLVRPLSKTGGRNNNGRVTTRHKGGGHKRAYRVIDFRRHDKDGVPAKVAHIEYDPNRVTALSLAPRPTSSPVTTYSCVTSRLVPWCTLLSCVPVAAPSWLVARVPPPS